MAGVAVRITGPAAGSVVPRRGNISIYVSPFSGVVNRVSLQFGFAGPVLSYDLTRAAGGSGVSWQFTDAVPREIGIGAVFQLTVTVYATIQIGWDARLEEPIVAEATGQATATYTMETVVPQLAIDPYQNPVGIRDVDAPYRTRLAGTTSEANPDPYPDVYRVASVEYVVGAGAPLPATLVGQRWTTGDIALPPGDTTVVVRAIDNWGTVTTLQRTITVRQYVMPTVVAPGTKLTTDLQIPTTSSVTSWTRLEPQVAGGDMALSANARVFDPLWMMTRQWQLGEFQGEDAGSPAQARVRATSARLTRIRYEDPDTAGAAGYRYDPAVVPLDVAVTQLPMRAVGPTDLRTLPLRIEAGFHFLRMLDRQPLSGSYRARFQSTFALQPLTADAEAALDEDTRRFVRTTVRRAPDAERCCTVFRNSDAFLKSWLPLIGVATVDVDPVLRTIRLWLAWYDGLFARGAPRSAWDPARLEYRASVAARLSADPADTVTLTATELDGSRVDWHAFDVDETHPIDTSADQAFASIGERTVPAPVHFPGAPAPRFWEMEDAKVAYALAPAGPTDLAHLMMVEYASSYGNDWYVVPLTIAVGTLTRVDSLVVTDTFGVRTLVRPMGDPGLPAPFFAMWQQSRLRRAGEPVAAPRANRFFLAPTIAQSIDGAPVEDVRLARDEMANVAWAIERRIESPLERALPLSSAPPAAAATPGGDLPRYLLAAPAPPNWVPLLPLQLRLTATGPVVQRLRRGAILQPDGTVGTRSARSEALKVLGASLLFDEEVPREGVRLTRSRRMARWVDGSTWVWTAFRNGVGEGERSSGLPFDQLEEVVR